MSSFPTITPARPLVLVGAGKMGAALLAGWLRRGLDPKAVIVVDPAPPEDSRAILREAGIVSQATVPAAASSVLVVAVKPQVVREALHEQKGVVGPGTIVLSIVAGTKIATLARGLATERVVRSMPNTPAQVGRGVTVAVAGAAVTAADRALVGELLNAVGSVGWIDDETLMDAVTAVSGSGPAYVFLLAETLAQAAVAAGLPPKLATQLARDTVAGAGELLQQSDLPAETLRQNVTSPNGTTAAALAVLMAEPGLRSLMTKAVEAARKRSQELAG
ncbi:MAG: pyrroline-5-carboxylate reductase [Bauldia sp.]|nr:pyrroline-5-carboxylate reductase [Bauldia sp.]